MMRKFTFRYAQLFLLHTTYLHNTRRLSIALVAMLSFSLGYAQPCTTPVVSFPAETIGCGQTTLDAGNTGATYLWSDGSTTQTLTVNGNGTYEVTVTNLPNCSASATTDVVINPVPVIDLGPNVTNCGGVVTLDPDDASGDVLTDQQQANTFSNVAGFYQTGIAQSFTPNHSTIVGASVTLSAAEPGTGDITIALYTDLPNNGGVLLASGTATDVNAGSIAQVDWDGVFITPGTTYYLVFTSSNPDLLIAGDIANPYAGGISYANANYDPFINYDYAFETFAGTSYQWSDGRTTNQIQVSTSGTYSVTVTNAYNCTASTSVEVYIRPVPVVNLGSDVSQCGGTVTLDAGTPTAQFRWSNNTTQRFLTVNSTNTYSVTVSDPNSGCTASDAVAVEIKPVPTVNLGPDVVTCATSATLNAGNAGSTYVWSTTETSQEVTITHNGFYIVTVTNPQSCSATGSANVTFNTVPALGADKSGDICPFTTANLTAFYVTQGLTTTYSAPVPEAVEAGTYTVIVSNAQGCADTANITINYLPKPDLGPDAQQTICPFTHADLTAFVNNQSLSYDYGKVANPASVEAGTYTIIGTNTSGCSDTLVVTISYAPKPNLGADRTDSVCIGYTIDLTTIYPNNGYSTYTWNTADPTNAAAGTYTLIVANGFGCTDTATVVITNRRQPVVTLTLPSDICYTESAFELTGGSPLGGIYTVDAVVADTFSPVVMGIGTHIITYRYTNTSGCTDSATQLLVVHPQPFVTTTLPPDLCTNSPVIDLDDYFTPNGGVYNGIGVSQHFFYPVLTPAGTDNIVNIYTDEWGCKDTSSYPITIHPQVHTQLISSIAEYSICVGQSVTFTASGAEEYEFFVNGVSQGTATTTNTFTTTTLNNLDQITVVGSNLCSTDTAGPILFDVHPLPVVNAGPDTTIMLGATVQLQGSATGNGPLIYQWYTSKGLNVTTIPNPIYSGTDTITFTLYVADTYGCMDSDMVTINVAIPDEVVLPNVITPDGDGLNDTWRVHPKVDLSGSQLVVFDRWGQKVYDKSNYANDWDGTYRATGKPLQDGTYYYVFTVPSQHNHVYRGAINILNGKN